MRLSGILVAVAVAAAVVVEDGGLAKPTEPVRPSRPSAASVASLLITWAARLAAESRSVGRPLLERIESSPSCGQYQPGFVKGLVTNC